MTVSELIEILRNEDQDRIVILQKDGEDSGTNTAVLMPLCDRCAALWDEIEN